MNINIIGKLAEYFTNRLGMIKHKAGWLQAPICPCPKKKESKFAVHLFKNKVRCFICGNLGTPRSFIMEHEGLNTYNEFNKLIRAFEGIEYEEPPEKLRQEKTGNLPESFSLLTFGNSQYGKSARAYVESRGFKVLDLTIKGVGYCTKGDFQGMLIFPYYENGNLIYFASRTFIGDKFFKNPDIDQFERGKTQLIHNRDALYIYKKVYVVESITNEYTLGDNAISIGGKIPSPWQLSEMIKSPTKFFVLFLDDDAYREALEFACKLSKYKKVKLIKMPKGKDVNNLGKIKSKALAKKIPYRKSSDFQRELWVTPKNNYA